MKIKSLKPCLTNSGCQRGKCLIVSGASCSVPPLCFLTFEYPAIPGFWMHVWFKEMQVGVYSKLEYNAVLSMHQMKSLCLECAVTGDGKMQLKCSSITPNFLFPLISIIFLHLPEILAVLQPFLKVFLPLNAPLVVLPLFYCFPFIWIVGRFFSLKLSSNWPVPPLKKQL